MESKRKYTTDIESTDKPIGVHCFEDAVEKIGKFETIYREYLIDIYEWLF